MRNKIFRDIRNRFVENRSLFANMKIINTFFPVKKLNDLVNKISTLRKKVSVFRVILVRILPHSDRIRRDIQSECGKIRTRVNPNTDTFHAVVFAC